MDAIDRRTGIADVVDDVAFRVIEIIVRGRGRIAGDEDDLGILGDGCRPFDVKRVFQQIVDATGRCGGGAGADLKRLAVAGDLDGRVPGVAGGQIEEGAEGVYIVVAVGAGDVGFADIDSAGSGDGDGLASAVDAGVPQRSDVVDGGEIPGADVFNEVGGSTGHADAELRRRGSGIGHCGMEGERGVCARNWEGPGARTVECADRSWPRPLA